MQYGFVIDQDKCIGCHACSVACKTEHAVPLGVNRTWVKYVEKGAWPDTKRFFSVLRCNHCTNAPCVKICPTTALHHREDGIVDFDTDRCIGCKSCMQACPYDALYIDPDEHTAQKCNYCAHRVEVGIEPACVVVCPEQAIIAGDLDDPMTQIARMVATEQLSQRAIEQGTEPNLWYKGAEQANLDPLAARPVHQGGSIWRDTTVGQAYDVSFLNVDLTPGNDMSGGPTKTIDDGGPPRVVYNTDHPMPWGWKVSSYFLTKGIAAGLAMVVAIALALGGSMSSDWAEWGVPLVAGVFLALTGALLVWDLKRPDRFYFLLTKGNPGSWLVRGAWVLSANAAVFGAWFLAGVFGGSEGLLSGLAWAGAILGVALAGYTAFLFGQAEARDLWQSPTLLWHMIAGGLAAGGGFTVLADLFVTLDGEIVRAGTIALTIGVIALGLIAMGELVQHHPTRNISEAVHHMTKGQYSLQWWGGGIGLGVVVPLLMLLIGGAIPLGIAGAAAMAGIWFADDAMVKAGQAVPLS